MDELIKQMGQMSGSFNDVVSVAQTVESIIASFILSLFVIFVYRETHKGTSYSQSYAQTLVLMSVVTSVIMLIIGSSIARAFSLVGALSIIRFRSAIKEPRDVGFMFLAMAVGMACGTGFYAVALTTALCVGCVMFLMSKLDIGAKPFSEVIMKVLLKREVDHNKIFESIFHETLQHHVLLSMDAVSDDLVELVYSVKIKKGIDDKYLIDLLQQKDGCSRVSILKGLQNINV